MTGQYEYIFRYYGVRPIIGGRVEHGTTPSSTGLKPSDAILSLLDATSTIGGENHG